MGNEQKPKRALYTKIDDTYYKINEQFNPTGNGGNLPLYIAGKHNQSNSYVEVRDRIVTIHTYVNTINPDFVISNKNRYDILVDYIKANNIKEIASIQNRFVSIIDYSIYNENGDEIFHNANMQEIKSLNSVYPYYENPDNDLQFKLIKSLMGEISIEIAKSGFPFGITKNTGKSKFILHINDISIYQDLLLPSGYTECHTSSNEVSYNYQSHLLEEALSHMKCIYSSLKTGGINFNTIELDFIPYKLRMCYTLILDDYILVYNEDTINDLLVENIINEAMTNEDTPDEPSIDGDSDDDL